MESEQTQKHMVREHSAAERTFLQIVFFTSFNLKDMLF